MIPYYSIQVSIQELRKRFGTEQEEMPIQFQCTGCHKNGLSCLGDLITHALIGLAEEPAGSAWTKAAAFSCRATDSWPSPKTRTATTTISDLVGMCSVSSFAVFLCLNSFLCLHSTDLKQTAPLPPFHCLLSLSSVMYGQQTVDSGQQMPGSSCVRLTALLKNVWRRSLRFMLSRCSRKGSIYQMRQPYFESFLQSLDLLNHRHHSGPLLALWTWISRFVAVVYACISSQSFQWLSQSRAWRLQLHPERSCQAKDASRTLQFLGKDEVLTLCSLEVQVVTPVIQNFMHPKLPASLLQVGWGIWMASERSGQVVLVPQSTSATKNSAKADFDMHVQLRAQDVEREGSKKSEFKFLLGEIDTITVR